MALFADAGQASLAAVLAEDLADMVTDGDSHRLSENLRCQDRSATLKVTATVAVRRHLDRSLDMALLRQSLGQAKWLTW